METLDCLGEEMVQKDVWNCAMEDHGALSVMTTGTTLMLKLCATSWALHEQVVTITLHILGYRSLKMEQVL